MRLHRTIGECEEVGYGERAGERAAELAVHFERGRAIDKAIQYHQIAGEQAVRRSANREAVAHFSKSLTLLSELPDTPEQRQQELTLQMALGAPLIALKGLAAPEVERTFDRARELSKDHAVTAQALPILIGLHNFYTVRGRYQIGEEFIRQGLHVAQQLQDPECLLEAETYWGDQSLLERRYPRGESSPCACDRRL